jgi:hypothetical protein
MGFSRSVEDTPTYLNFGLTIYYDGAACAYLDIDFTTGILQGNDGYPKFGNKYYYRIAGGEDNMFSPKINEFFGFTI